MILDATLSFLGVFLYLFIFWKKLREDYIKEQIFSSSLFVLIGMFVGGLISYYFAKDWWFWLMLAGGVVGAFLAFLKYRMRVYETLETYVASLIPWYGIYFLGELWSDEKVVAAANLAVSIGLIAIYKYLDSRYKGFLWYKSGKIGFSGLMVVGLSFLSRSVVALIFGDVLSFMGTKDAILSGVLAFISFFSVYNLANKKA